ncbi:hypothetical protein [Kribbella sp. NPDC051718]|uniref:hypothetical protein n=1 Tax=Kribbella sp. NPDC051718 TaxID=3155168 RepID=UPI00343FEFAD
MIAALVSVGQASVGTSPAAAPGSLTSHVESARPVNSGPGFVHEGDPVPDWLGGGQVVAGVLG